MAVKLIQRHVLHFVVNLRSAGRQRKLSDTAKKPRNG